MADRARGPAPLRLFVPAVLLVALERVADLVDDFGGDHAADDADRESRRPRGDDGAHAGPGAVVTAAVVVVTATVMVLLHVARVRIVVRVGAVAPVRSVVLDEPADPGVDHGVPVPVARTLMTDDVPVEGVVPLGEEAAALVGLQYHLHAVGVREEGQFDLADHVGVLGRRGELDLLVEGQLLAGATDAAQFEVGGLEAVAQLPEGLEDRLLDGKRAHVDLVEITPVPGAGHREFGAQPEYDTQALPVQLGDRGLPGQRHTERDTALLALGETEAAADGESVEDDGALVFPVVGLGLDTGDEFERDELSHLIGESHEQGQLPADTAELLDHALGFSERTLDEVMVPRADAVFVRKEATLIEAVELIAKHGHSNYPVFGDHPDDIIGVLGVRDLTRLPAAGFVRATAGEAARRPLLLPDTLPLPRAVARMREQDDEFAVVLDEHGGVAGIVTYEDIAEELVGDIADETDTVVLLAVAEGSGWLVDAGRRLDEVEDATGIALPEEDDYDTVAGLIIDRLGRFPAIGDRLTVDLPDGGRADIEVLSLDRHVPERVRIERLTDEQVQEQEPQA